VIRACVIGWPISHSRSPLIHGTWLARYGIPGAYERQPVPPEELPRFLEEVRSGSLAGCNVTVPHKSAALALADAPDALARRVGATNTLWMSGGKLRATNTDVYGFMAHLASAVRDWRARPGSPLVLGAGGAARAVCCALIEAGVPRLWICNRSIGRAELLASDFAPSVEILPWSERNQAVTGASLIVNTTTLGMAGQPDLDLDISSSPRSAVFYDLVYVPLETQMLARARAHGLAAVDGLGMLLHQAVPGFELWFRKRPEVTPELRAIVAADIEGGRC
jgi:shikimate dehydrogenase